MKFTREQFLAIPGVQEMLEDEAKRHRKEMEKWEAWFPSARAARERWERGEFTEEELAWLADDDDGDGAKPA